MRIVKMALALSTLISFHALADWQLDQPSAIHFVTTKNTNVSEVHTFGAFDGSVSDSGQANITIGLSSVDTRIGIRDERIEKHLFEIPQFTQATFSAQIPKQVLENVKAGANQNFTLEGMLSLHGSQAKAITDVIITANKNGTVTVSSIAPMLIDSETFGLVAGVQKLREIAGLKSISNIVPLTFVLTFKQN